MPLRPFIVLVVLTTALCAQTKPAPLSATDKNEAEKAAALWRDRAERLTSAALEDSWHIHPWDAVLKAHLAEAWWKDDPYHAQAWLAEANEEVSRPRKNEPDKESTERLQAATFVFEAMNRLDQKAADKLLAYISSQAKDLSEHDSQRIDGYLQMNLAEASMDDVSAARVEQLGNAAMAMRGNQEMQRIVDNLASKDSTAASRLYLTALNTAAQNNDFDMIFGLMQYPFPFYNSPLHPPEDVKQQTLSTVGQMLLRIPQSDQEADQFCQGTAPEIARHLLPDFPASQQGLIEARLRTCGTAPSSDEEAHGPDPDRCKTADDCLQLSATAKSPKLSVQWKQTALGKLHDDQQLQALDILNSLTPEEKEVWPGWTTEYVSHASFALRLLRQQHDSKGIQQVIDGAPDKFRALVILDFVATLIYVREKDRDVDFARTILSQARRVLEEFGSEDPRAYLQMLQFYVKLIPEEAPQTLGFIVTGLNGIEYRDPESPDKNQSGVRYAPPGKFVRPVGMNAILLERDEPYTLAAIKTLDDPKGRIAFRLGLLNSALKRYDEEIQKAKAPTSKPATKQAAAH